MSSKYLNDRELATVLAALRLYQKTRSNSIPSITSIATDGGQFEELTNTDIDELVERLNFGGLPEPTDSVEGFHVGQSVFWNDPDDDACSREDVIVAIDRAAGTARISGGNTEVPLTELVTLCADCEEAPREEGELYCETCLSGGPRDSGPDIRVAYHGTVVILTPLTPAGRDWLTDHIDPEAMRWGTEGYVAEPRYVQPILEGAAADGLSVG